MYIHIHGGAPERQARRCSLEGCIYIYIYIYIYISLSIYIYIYICLNKLQTTAPFKHHSRGNLGGSRGRGFARRSTSRFCTRRESRVRHDQTSSYLRPPFLGTQGRRKSTARNQLWDFSPGVVQGHPGISLHRSPRLRRLVLKSAETYADTANFSKQNIRHMTHKQYKHKSIPYTTQ